MLPLTYDRVPLVMFELVRTVVMLLPTDAIEPFNVMFELVVSIAVTLLLSGAIVPLDVMFELGNPVVMMLFTFTVVMLFSGVVVLFNGVVELVIVELSGAVVPLDVMFEFGIPVVMMLFTFAVVMLFSGVIVMFNGVVVLDSGGAVVALLFALDVVWLIVGFESPFVIASVETYPVVDIGAAEIVELFSTKKE